jgi:hypothetical protein
MLISHCAARSGARVRARYARLATWGAVAVAAVGMFSAADAGAAVLTIGGTPVTSVPAAKYYNFQPAASDSLHRTLSFSVANKPAWAGFDPTYGRLYGSPTPGNVGTYRNIVITVSDGQYTATLPAFSITVTPLADPGPVIRGTPSTAAVVGKSYSFQPSASDSYGLRMVFSVYNKPAWLTLNSATGQLSGTPGPTDVGTYSQIVESVTDGYVRSTLQAFNLKVAAAAGSPSSGVAPPQSATASVNLQWQPPTENTDSSALTNLAGYHVYYGTSPQALNASVTVANPGIASYVVENLTPGTWYFAVAGYNSSGVEGELSNVASSVAQ